MGLGNDLKHAELDIEIDKLSTQIGSLLEIAKTFGEIAANNTELHKVSCKRIDALEIRVARLELDPKEGDPQLGYQPSFPSDWEKGEK